jgi:hypothetical protein
VKGKSKDVTPRSTASHGDVEKKSVDSLPKILGLACRSGSLQRQRVCCGKANCRCARGELHEGYYFFFWTHTRMLKIYVRRTDVETVARVISARRRRQAAFRVEMNEARAFLRQMMSAVKVRI